MIAPEKHVFQAETRQLLDIVIHSLYTDKEIFIRELVSNAADACEKYRFLQSSGTQTHQSEIEASIAIATDDVAKTISITDTGVGMSRNELVENLGTIAHSGSKAFLKKLREDNAKSDAHLIGQFGVGFYSAFMVANEVQILTRSYRLDEPGHSWISDGKGTYEIGEAADWSRGTRILVKLKDEDKRFSESAVVKEILKRYSNFVPFSISLNGEIVNKVSAIWSRNKNEITDAEYREFYEFIGHDHEAPLGRIHFAADAPISIAALLFIPAKNIENLGLGRSENEVHLYCRRILIEQRSKKLFPEWLRFLKGVVDSEDFPLNISRESLQDSALVQRLGKLLTSRFLKYMETMSQKDADGFDKIYDAYQRFFKEGILSDFTHREALGRLLRFESSSTEKGNRSSLADYVKRMTTDQKEIYFVFAPTRESAESSPYYEAFRSKGFEVLFLYDPWDEMVMEHLGTFEKKQIISSERANVKIENQNPPKLSDEEIDSLGKWLRQTLGESIARVKASERLTKSPAVVVDADKTMTANRRRLMKAIHPDSEKAQYDFEINPNHPLIKRLYEIKTADESLAKLVAAQLFDNARMAAGVLEDPRELVTRLNSLLEKVLK